MQVAGLQAQPRERGDLEPPAGRAQAPFAALPGAAPRGRTPTDFTAAATACTRAHGSAHRTAAALGGSVAPGRSCG
jgi:hypothetical protein